MCLCSKDEKIWKLSAITLSSQTDWLHRLVSMSKSYNLDEVFFFFLVYRSIPVFKTRTNWDNIRTASRHRPLEHFFISSRATSFCIYYVSDSEALSGEDKEDLLCSIQCRPWALKQGSSPTEYSLTNSGSKLEKTTKPGLKCGLFHALLADDKQS